MKKPDSFAELLAIFGQSAFSTDHEIKLNNLDEDAWCTVALALAALKDDRLNTLDQGKKASLLEVIVQSEKLLAEYIAAHTDEVQVDAIQRFAARNSIEEYAVPLLNNVLAVLDGTQEFIFNRAARKAAQASWRLTDKMELLREIALEPHMAKHEVKISAQDIGNAVGKTTSMIRKLFENPPDGLPLYRVDEETGRRYYTTEHLIAACSHYNVSTFGRPEGKPGFILTVANQKGGVGKSTTALLIAHKAALAGASVLVVDCDPQSTTSSISGAMGLMQPKTPYALEDCLLHERFDISEKVQSVENWPNIDIIPCQISAQKVEWDLHDNNRNGSHKTTQRLWLGLNTVKYNYDLIVIDTPPSLSTFNLNAVDACDGLIMPLQPACHDLDSTNFYLEYLANFFENHASNRGPLFMRILLTNYKSGQSSNDVITALLRDNFDDMVLENTLQATSAIPSAAMQMCSIYEDSKCKTSSRSTMKRAKDSADRVCDEIFTLIRERWDQVE